MSARIIFNDDPYVSRAWIVDEVHKLEQEGYRVVSMGPGPKRDFIIVAEKVFKLLPEKLKVEIDYDGHLKCEMEIINGNVTRVLRAVNGYGEKVNCEKVTIKIL